MGTRIPASFAGPSIQYKTIHMETTEDFKALISLFQWSNLALGSTFKSLAFRMLLHSLQGAKDEDLGSLLEEEEDALPIQLCAKFMHMVTHGLGAFRVKYGIETGFSDNGETLVILTYHGNKVTEDAVFNEWTNPINDLPFGQSNE